MLSFFFSASFAAELQARLIDFRTFPNGELEVVEALDHEWIDWMKEKASHWAPIGNSASND